MSSFADSTNNFLPLTYIIPDEESERNLKLRDYLNSIASATNTKESGYYDSIITLNGQQFFPTFSTSTASNANYRDVYRKVIDTGGLPNNTSKSVAHGIPFSSSYSVTRIYGAATSPNTTWIPLPYASPTLANNISLEANNTNVVITTGSDRTSFTRSFVVIEWITTT